MGAYKNKVKEEDKTFFQWFANLVTKELKM